MSVLDHLQKTLRNLNRVALAKLRPGDSIQMLNERAKLQEWIGGGSTQLEETTAGTIEDALRAYRENNYLKGLRQIRLACYGCTQSLDHDNYRLIENREQFEQLLIYAERYSNRPTALRKLYHGLLGSYFSYDPYAPDTHPAGRANWEMLREFLKKHLNVLQTPGFTPGWLATLTRHPNLLGEAPCRPYEHLVFDGDWAEFDELREQLEINTSSWLVREMVKSPIKTIEGMEDAAFKEHIDSILLLLHSYRIYADDGLAILLDRYERCADQRINRSLRDFSVALWGNPWLPENIHQWRCGTKARDMLSHWLKRHLLKGFFSLLSNDDKKRSRRFDFWELYSEDLSGMYFALGKNALEVSNLELYKFRRTAKGLITRLPEGKPDVHACIMQFKNHHVVEFNRENNVAYLYDLKLGTPHFYLSKGWAEIGALSVTDVSQGIDVSRQSRQLRHQDTPQLSWEGHFARELGPSENAIKAFCQKYQCGYTDSTDLDGRLWIRPRDLARYGPEVWSILNGWGYTLSNEENGYYSSVSLNISL